MAGFYIKTLALFVVILAATFGGLLDRPHPTNDDPTWFLDTKRMSFAERAPGSVAERLPVLARLAHCFTKPREEGHYKPVTRCIWTLEYAVAGDRHWMTAVVLVALVMHLVLSFLLVVLLEGIGLGRPVAFLAGLLCLVNPVSDIALTGANGSINLNGLFFLVAAAVLWLRAAPGRRMRPWSLAVCTVLFFLSINSNPIFLAMAPMTLVLIAVTRLLQRRVPFRRWIAELALRMIPLVIAFGATIWMRLTFYGHLLTPSKRALTFHEGEGFLAGMWNNFFLLEDPHDVRLIAYEGIDLPASHAVATGQWLLAALLALLCAWASYRVARSCAAPGQVMNPRALMRGVILVAGLIAFGCGAYYVSTGANYVHRYMYVGVPGFSLLLALVAALVTALIWKATTKGAGLIVSTILVALVAGRFSVANVRSVASASYGYRACRLVAEAVADLRWRHPELERVIVFDLPVGVRRAGLMYVRDTALTNGVEMEYWNRYGIQRPHDNPPASGRGVFHGAELLRRWSDLSGDEEMRRTTAVVLFDRDALRVEVVERVSNLQSLDAPGPLDFGPGLVTPFVRGHDSRGRVRHVREAQIAYRTEPPRRGVLRLRRELRSKPRQALAKLDAKVESYGRDLEPALIELLSWNRRDVRQAAAEKLSKLWSIDDERRARTLLGSPNERIACAAARIVAMSDRDWNDELIRIALARDLTAVVVVQEKARRNDRLALPALESRVAHALDSLKVRLAAGLARLGRPGYAELCAAAVVDDRTESTARWEALAALLSVEPGWALPVIEHLVRSPSLESELWPRIPALVPLDPGPLGLRLMMAAARKSGLSHWDEVAVAGAWSSTMSSRFRAARAGRFLTELETVVSMTKTSPKKARARINRLKKFAVDEPLGMLEYWPLRIQADHLAGRRSDAMRGWLDEASPGVRSRLRLERQLEVLTAEWDGGPGIRVDVELPELFSNPGRPGTTVGIIVSVRNESDRFLAGGPGPLTAKVRPTLIFSGDVEIVSAPYDLPVAGLAPGERVSIVVPLAIPKRRGQAWLRAVLLRLDKPGSAGILARTPAKVPLPLLRR